MAACAQEAQQNNLAIFWNYAILRAMKNEPSNSTSSMIKLRYTSMLPMDEATKRKWAASEALAIGWGGESLVSQATGISRTTIRKGIHEVKEDKVTDSTGETKLIKRTIRAFGGGRKKLIQLTPSILADLHGIIEPVTSRDPIKNTKWPPKSTYKIAAELSLLGYKISPDTVRRLLKERYYGLQSNLKSIESINNTEINKQFIYINNIISIFKNLNYPIISVDINKKELVSCLSNNITEWQKNSELIKVNIYNFLDSGIGKAAPFGVYDIQYNKELVNIDINHDTAEFAVETIKKWWINIGKIRYDNSPSKLLILTNSDGSNLSRSRLWRFNLQKFANMTNMKIYVCHYPPGISKYNKIELRMFSYISINYREKPITSFNIIVNVIENTTKKNTKTYALLDKNKYDVGSKISNKDFNTINIKFSPYYKSKFNYCISPKRN